MNARPFLRAPLAGALVLLAALLAAPAAGADTGRVFIPSAREHPDATVTLPLHRGTSQGRTVWYVVTEASDEDVARALGAGTVAKLANARSTAAVQRVTMRDGVVDFPASVDFVPQRSVVPGPGGFPPSVAGPGAVGERGYSPLVQLPDGTILNAPQVANATGRADKVVAIDRTAGTVTYRETHGFANGDPVLYASFDSSNPVAAALEDVTYAPALDAAPSAGDDSTHSSRAMLVAFTNGQTGAQNPERQGLSSAILDGLDPLNVLRWTPNQGRYSPLWDVHLAQWTARAVARGLNVRQEDAGHVQELVDDGLVSGPGGTRFGASGFIVNCPIVSAA